MAEPAPRPPHLADRYSGMRRVRRVHFVGIGGAGMGGIAEVLHTLGLEVTGSDRTAGAMTARLRELGVRVDIGHDRAHVANAEVVVVSAAVGADNPEVIEAGAGMSRWCLAPRCSPSSCGFATASRSRAPTARPRPRASSPSLLARGRTRSDVRHRRAASSAPARTRDWERASTWWRRPTRATLRSSCFIPSSRSSPTSTPITCRRTKGISNGCAARSSSFSTGCLSMAWRCFARTTGMSAGRCLRWRGRS